MAAAVQAGPGMDFHLRVRRFLQSCRCFHQRRLSVAFPVLQMSSSSSSSSELELEIHLRCHFRHRPHLFC